MTIERINPPELMEPEGYTHAIRATGTTIYIAGQGAYNADRELVGPGDHYLQSKQAFTNVLQALKGAGATFDDVVKANYLVVGLDMAALEAFGLAMSEVLGPDAKQPAATMIGVEALGYPEMLVEFEVIAVV